MRCNAATGPVADFRRSRSLGRKGRAVAQVSHHPAQLAAQRPPKRNRRSRPAWVSVRAPVEPKLAPVVTHRQSTRPESRVVEEKVNVQPPGRWLWYATTPGSQFPETAWAYHLGLQAPSWQLSRLRVPVSESYAVETPRLTQVCKLPPLVSFPRNAALALDRAVGAFDRRLPHSRPVFGVPSMQT